MKKLAIVLLLSVLAFSAFAQGKPVDELNGFDWVTWSLDAQVGFIRGFYAAYVSVMSFAVFTNKDNPNSEAAMQNVQNQFYIPLTVGEFGLKIDEFYSQYSNRKYTLWQVAVFLAGKAWWE